MSRLIVVKAGLRRGVIAAGLRGQPGSGGTVDPEFVQQLQQALAELEARVITLESGRPIIPSNAMTDSEGRLLVDGDGQILITGVVA